MSMSQVDELLTEQTGKPETRQRSAWRQRFVAAERGFTTCFRSSSTLFFYFFAVCTLISVAVVVELRVVEWALTIFCVLTALAAEMTYDSVQRFVHLEKKRLGLQTVELLNVICAACMMLICGSAITVLFVLAARIIELDWF
ncbi:diacylglycerol kinase [Rubinisphaera margarita]|uniref:diacylglycerol kinase n=1 Tax=Rubinisphaera margarita TaxID=2909586 RepID=UPI001EE7E39D|nr:diacylglycerol kinase [Rubinisphaera margarita]MCG6154767.1 diacylglycerol kinase [Rubinisphaera margarita]